MFAAVNFREAQAKKVTSAGQLGKPALGGASPQAVGKNRGIHSERGFPVERDRMSSPGWKKALSAGHREHD